jgi:hypothetical protein
MNYFFNIITHLIIITSICLMVYHTFLYVSKKLKEADDITEGFLLVGTIILSSFTYIASKMLGLSIPSLLFEGLEQADALSFKILFGSIISSSVGFLLSWYITNKLSEDKDIAIRILLFIITLMILLFGDVYIGSWGLGSQDGFNKALLPNVLFVIGVLSYAVFNHKKK